MGQCSSPKFQDPLPQVRLLDPRPASQAVASPISHSVNIPFAELGDRISELPPRDEAVRVAGPAEIAEETVQWLRDHGRLAARLTEFSFAGNSERTRLWSPNEWLWIFLNTERSNSPKRGTGLDLGCGNGRDSVYLAACGWRVHAVDVLSECMDRGRSLANRYLDPSARDLITWHTADVLKADYAPAETCDLVTLFHLFDRDLLQRAKHWLNPGGVLLVEAFTTIRKEQHGRPASSDRVVCPDEMKDLLSDMEIVRFTEAEQRQGHTARYWARKPY